MGARDRAVERVRGASDLTPDEWAAVNGVRSRLAETYSLYGYKGVDVPVLEHTELFLRKAGASVTAQIYSFIDRGGRNVCLRPEFTASIARFYASQASKFPLPARLFYSGPAFRYEKPQRGTYRQFTESGVELIGAQGATADAEVIELAVAALTRLGLRQFNVVLGHLGILSNFLAGLGLSERIESLLREGMESLRRADRGIEHVRARLGSILEGSESSGLAAASQQLAAVLAQTPGLGREQLRGIIAAILAGLEINLDGGRDAAEIVDRLLSRLTRGEESQRLERALEFIERLARVAAEPAQALRDARALVKEFELSPEPLDYADEVFAQLGAAGVDTGKFIFNPALGRGLQYYTGVVFEIFASNGGSPLQLCGGGRYDDLIGALAGGPPTPAVGLTFGVERLLMASSQEGLEAAVQPPSTVLLAAVGEKQHAYAARVASSLRKAGIKVERDLKGRSLRGNLQFADKALIPVVVIVGEREAEAERVSVRLVASGEERDFSLEALPAELRKLTDLKDPAHA